MNYRRSLLPLALFAAFGVVGVAHAQVNFSNIVATYTLNPGGSPINWFNFPNGPAMSITFTGNAPAFKVGASTGFSDGTSRITYDVSGSTPIIGIDLLIQGNLQDWGHVHFSESASDGSGSLGSISGDYFAGNYSGGVNGAYTHLVHLSFSRPSTTFSVVKSFGIDINLQSLPSTSIAEVALVEQNLNPVPEPGSLAALGMGALALLRKRRK